MTSLYGKFILITLYGCCLTAYGANFYWREMRFKKKGITFIKCPVVAGFLSTLMVVCRVLFSFRLSGSEYKYHSASF